MTDEQMAMLREFIQEPYSEAWSNDRLEGIFIGAGGNLERAASLTWRIKASSYAGLVDVSENGSSRKMSDLYKNALALSAEYGARADADTALPSAGRPRTAPIVRA